MLPGRSTWSPVAANVHEQSAVIPLNNRRFSEAEARHKKTLEAIDYWTTLHREAKFIGRTFGKMAAKLRS